MKKSLLALAAIAAVSGSAFAQSSVTMYGQIDQGVGQQSETVKNREVLAGSANRLGFRGVEDLGGGLKAFFEFQHRFSADTGVANSTFWDGKSFVGLQTAFGNVYLGREDNPAYALSQSAGDPWGTDTVAQNTTILNGRGIGTNRYANSVNYRGTFGGFTVGAQIAEADGSKRQSTGEDRPWSVAGVYTGGPITIGFGYEDPANTDAYWATVNGAWDFKVVKLIGLYGWGETGVGTPTQTGGNVGGGTSLTTVNNERKAYIIGLTAPIGNGELKASYGQLDNKNKVTGVKSKLDKQFGLGYHYALSKRTTIYADYVNEGNDAVKAAGSNLEKNGYDFGIKHKF
ncbi:porin [Piscinibacter gummiphilus]|nr:porin [Piscinibacter gummiphilus]